MKMKLPVTPDTGEILLYQTEDGQTRLAVAFRGETCWLSLNQPAELFQRDKSVISRHISNIYEEGELRREATVAKYATVQKEGDKEVKRQIDFFYFRRDHFRRLSCQVPQGHPVPNLGHRALVSRCLKALASKRIPKCNIFLFGTNASGKAFWQHNGWKLRQNLRVLQKKTKEFYPARKTRGRSSFAFEQFA
jgi:hypothetical protein